VWSIHGSLVVTTSEGAPGERRAWRAQSLESALRAQSLERRAWSAEPGAQSLERRAWSGRSAEPGAQSLERRSAGEMFFKPETDQT
jgi:hypothetical protein